jgi:DNA polymerase-3 subunit epsilon
MREICLDTETTGLDPKDGHKIVEIACVELIDKVKTGNVLHFYINPRREMPIEAFNIHGLSTEFLSDKPIFDHLAQKFLDFIQDAKLVIHNAAFDLKFLNHELRSSGLEAIKNEVVDSLLIARKKFPGSPNSLDALCKRFNIDLSKRTKHGALLDTELLCDVYVELMGGLQSGFGFDEKKSAKAAQELVENEARKAEKETTKIIPARNFPLTKEEEELHKKFILDNFKENLWNY